MAHGATFPQPVTDPMSPTRYSRPRALLHWSSALVILWASLSGYANAAWPLPGPIARGISQFNVALTTLLIPVFLLRIACALAQPGPDDGVHAGTLGRFLARAGHLALYVATAAVLLSGALMMDRPIDLFGQASLPQPLAEPVLLDFFNSVHHHACLVLALLVGGHVGAVLIHQWHGHRVLARMKP